MTKQDTRQLIYAERIRQDAKWGGPLHDEAHMHKDWEDYITEHTTKALRLTVDPALRQRIIEVAALGFAAIACLARARGMQEIRAGFHPTHGA